MEWLLYLVAALLFLLGAVCVVLVVIQLPGAWILLALAAVVEYCDRFYLPEGDRQTFGWWVLGSCLILLVIGEIVEFIAGALGAQKGGSSRRGTIGALVGGIAGIFIFTPLFFFVPLFGAFLGAVLGTFVGAIVGELSAERATLRGSVRPAVGATIGRVLGTTGKVAIAVAVWLALSISAFWP
ncbi:MAG: DUF456 family protein [Planctomycetota bacterium]|jgi:uncharacterized protein YqgC (DUF456 family)